MKLFKRDKIELRHEIFIPGSPIKNRKYLFGREQEIKDLENILKRSGQHAIIIGDRGVGKTSLVKQVLYDNDYSHVFRSCDPQSSFDSVFRGLLKDSGVDFRNFEETNETTNEGELKAAPGGVGISGKQVSKRSEKFTKSQQDLISPWTVFESLKEYSEKIILFIDEYDAIGRSKNAFTFHQSTAYTMKVLSDQNDECDSRLIIVGVARSSLELLGKHESIQRCAREIYVRPLRTEDIFDFLTAAEDELEIKFEDFVKERLAKGSLGYPYFVHLVGLECIEAMLNRDAESRIVTKEDFSNAITKSVNQAFRAELAKYKIILDQVNTVEKNIIEGLALYNNPYPKRTEIRQYICSKYKIAESDFERALNRLTQEKRFLYLSRREDEVRFADPLMKAFLKEKMLNQLRNDQQSSKVQLELFPKN